MAISEIPSLPNYRGVHKKAHCWRWCISGWCRSCRCCPVHHSSNWS